MTAQREDKSRSPCPDCPDGYVWTEKGPTDKACATCGGKSYIEHVPTLFICGPKKCDHDYSGEEPIEDGERICGSTAVCVKCGARAFEEAAWQ